MSKNKNYSQNGNASRKASIPKSVSTASSPKVKKVGNVNNKQSSSKNSWQPLLPVPVVVFILVWMWAVLCQGDVFRMVRENSFFAFDSTLMHYEMQKPYGVLWCIGRALLTTFRYPWLGGLLLSFLLTGSCWLLGYALRLSAKWRWIQYLPLIVYTGIFTYIGMGNWFEAESGQAMGIPAAIFIILLVWGLLIRSFSRKPTPAIIRIPKDETKWQNRIQILVAALMLAIPMFYAHKARPYVTVTAKMQVAVMNEDWQRVIDIAHDNDELSYRPMAAMYAIALVQTGQIGDKLFDIRLDYDSIYCRGFNREGNNTTNLYMMDCDLHAGLVETAYHHAMETMAMEGPTVRNLKMLCKASLLRSEWEVADKYLTILDKVPFEGDFVEKYRPMCGDTAKVNADPVFAMVRNLEPIHDTFENRFIQPVFLGYNAALMEGRSLNALWNSLMVHIYTKTMQDFLFRCRPLAGTTPPASMAEALTLLSNKNPELLKQFSGLEMLRDRLVSFINDTRQYMDSPEERAKHARELFPRYKGYYPYYYFFGNLKATRKTPKKDESSNSGVN